MSETPTTYRYYPALSDIIKTDDLPDFLSFIKQGLQTVFDKIYYKDYQVSKSVSGSSAFYSLQLVSRTKLALELPGTGVYFVLNPDYEDINISSFPVTVFWQWEVMRYIRYFNLNGFSFTPEDFYHLALEVLNVTEEQVLQLAINTFVVSNDPVISKIDQLIADINRVSNSTIAIDNTAPNPLQQLLIQIELINKKVFPLVFSLYLLANNLEETKKKIKTFFASFIPDDIEGYIKNIITPKARVTLKLSAAVEFPRNILVPWKDVGGVLQRDEDPTHIARFQFAEALLYADTKAGIGYNLELAGTLNPTYCEIGKTGILIQIESLKLDLSKKKNIPEADADGRPADFTGVYARAISVTLPARWFHPEAVPGGTQTTLRIGAYELLVGTGGISGTIILEAVPVIIPGQSPYYYEDKFNLVYPVTLFQKNATTNEIVETPVADITQLKNLLFPPASSNVPPYSFKFPLTLVELPAAGGQTRIFTNAADYQLYLTTLANDGILWKRLGGANGFRIGFSKFDISFKQNHVTSSNLKAALEIPKFKSQANPNLPLRVDLEGHLYDDGDFSFTASVPGGIPANLFNFVKFNFLTFELGRQDDNFYVGTSCEVQFENAIMKKIFGEQKIVLPRVRIYSNGHMEIVGGNAFIPTNLSLHLGPIDISVTGIYFGSYQQMHNGNMRKYNYFGFDGAISIDPLGIDGKGKGIKYYYTVDNDDKDANGNPKFTDKDNFLRVETIEVDLVIPGTANPATAIAIIHGAVSIPKPGDSPEYMGEVSLKLPKAKIAGGAAMRLQPKSPAFIIDAFVDLPAPIPIGPVGIYGFRGLIGFRYVAEKEAVGLVSGVDTWYDYYKYPPKGINIRKFSGPERTKNYTFPFSIGAGAVLGTSFDSGTVLSIRAMLLLSIPTLFMIEGRATILSARLGLTDDKEPPFFAFIAWGDNSLELGLGADFKMPSSNGWIIDLHAEVQAGFFFNNASRWYVNFGTKQNPIKARILTILTAQSYLMISSKGIEAGARVEFDLRKHFGPAKVHIYAYVEVGGRISFERPQIGGYLAFGGMIDIEIWIIGVSIGLDAILSVEAAKPFLLFAQLRLRVCVKIIVKVCKSFTVELKWEKDGQVDRTPIPALPNSSTSQDRTRELVQGVNMLTNETFPLNYFSGVPSESAIVNIIPLDTYIDIKTAKGLIPNAVNAKIGGQTGAAENFTDLVSPESISRSGRQLRQVKHTYSIEAIEVKAWNGSQWVDYHPYRAIMPTDPDPKIDGLRIGYWQRSGNQYDTIRLLATNPFSYTEGGEPGWFIPEQYGINPSSLFCKTKEETHHCSNVLNKQVGTIYYPPTQYVAHLINGAYYTLLGGAGYDPSGTGIAGLNGDYMKVTDDYNPFGFQKSLSFNNYNSLVMLLPDPSASVKLQFTTNATGATISYYKKRISDQQVEPQYDLVNSVYKTATELMQVIPYENTVSPISKVVIAPATPNAAAIAAIMQQIAALFDNTYQGGSGVVSVTEPADKEKYAALLAQLAQLQGAGCSTSSSYFFSNFYSSAGNAIRDIHFKDIVKLGEYYLVTAQLKPLRGIGGDLFNIIFKLDKNGNVVTEKTVNGSIKSISVNNGEVLLTVAAKPRVVLLEVYPVMLLRLDAALNQLKGIQLDPILSWSYHQLCLFPESNYAFWFSSNQVDKNAGAAASAFTNGTRILLIDTITLEIKDSVFIPGFTATKGVAKDASSYIFITEQSINSTPESVIVVELTADARINITDRYFVEAYLNDIAVLQTGEIIVTGRTVAVDTTGVHVLFVGLLNPDLIDANSKLYAYAGAGLGTENLKLGNSSMQEGQVWIAAYNSTNVLTLTFNNGMLIKENKKIVNPAPLQGPPIKIHKIVNDPASKEVLMLSGEPGYYKGGIVSVIDEQLACCMLINESFNNGFERIVLQLGSSPQITDHTDTSSDRISNLVTASAYMTVKQEMCPPIIHPGTTLHCTTSLQQLCWLTVAQHEYNISIPGQDAITADQQAMVLAMQKTAQPIWRPNTKYYVHFRLKDTVDNGSSTPGLYDYYYGFKTVGPVGHYHLHPAVKYVQGNIINNVAEYIRDNADRFPLTSLRQYIDYNRSYPNADGNLLQAKPLFYGNQQCKISIFFAKATAYHMLQTWKAYNGLPELTGDIHISIKDPVSDQIIPYPLPVGYTSETVPLPDGDPVWSGDDDPRIPLNIQMLNNMIKYINANNTHIQCVLSIGAPIVPKAYTYGVKLTNLKPLKLYTAIISNAFETDSNNVLRSEKVHQFVFQTSRYANFAEQVNSFVLKDDAGNQKQAVFKIPLAINAAAIDTAYNIAANVTDPASVALETKYVHFFDRATEGVLGFKPADPAVTTEFNLLKNGINGDTIGILIRNPEPFNIPKIPLEEIAPPIALQGQFTPAVAVLNGSGQVDNDYLVLHSKDYAQVLIMHSSKKITAASLAFRFVYKTWNGSIYTDSSTIITPQILLNI
jgi:hypothetical protein